MYKCGRRNALDIAGIKHNPVSDWMAGMARQGHLINVEGVFKQSMRGIEAASGCCVTISSPSHRDRVSL